VDNMSMTRNVSNTRKDDSHFIASIINQ